jgi:hypothetical protein
MLQSLNAKKDGTVTVKMDMADAWGTFTVTSGWNTMYYTYADNCGDEKFCTGNEIQSGVFRVFVNYVEKTLDGSQTISASRAECEKAK